MYRAYAMTLISVASLATLPGYAADGNNAPDTAQVEQARVPVNTVWRCGEQAVSFSQGEESIRLTVGGETFDLRPVKAASGAKYEALDDPATTLWNKGAHTTLVVRGKPYPECRPADQEEQVFRAGGNEPGWRLDINDGEMKFTTQGGDTDIVTPTPVAETTREFKRYAATTAKGDLTVTIFDRPCMDSMSGMPHPNSVVIVLDGKELKGCGGDPAALLRGAEWRVEELNGTDLVERSQVTLNFVADGRVSGNSSCNSYTGEYALTGEGLTFGKTATTMMACDPALMTQESLFHAVLQDVRRFELGSDDALILHTDDGRTITARREQQATKDDDS